MRRLKMRLAKRQLLAGLAVAMILILVGVQAARWVQLRGRYLEQVDYCEVAMLEIQRSEIIFAAERVEPGPPEALVNAQEQARRERHQFEAEQRQWQRLADHPWEAVPPGLVPFR